MAKLGVAWLKEGVNSGFKLFDGYFKNLSWFIKNMFFLLLVDCYLKRMKMEDKWSIWNRMNMASSNQSFLGLIKDK